jgi:hypothetical protein
METPDLKENASFLCENKITKSIHLGRYQKNSPALCPIPRESASISQGWDLGVGILKNFSG